MAQHKWHKEIKAWADGAEIESKDITTEEWVLTATPQWYEDYEYRIKPEPKKEDWVFVCKKCGDELGIVYEPKEPQYLYVYTNELSIRLTPHKLEEFDQQRLMGVIELKEPPHETT